ncbi:Hpt domain-containing protein [Pseudomonas aeruginosa]|uniref:Hpt domain-containing protein n=1 Tax=Pseudomonas aeruginosa TaxID=287 RepID=UPI0006650D31|nr:Hpt domain-containing protein [Pseudomonas aeruginosa]
MGDRHDYVALEWVKGEIAETLKQARQALEAFVENPQDPTRMRFCLTYVHQVQGTLQMVEFYGAALLAEEMEQLVQALLDGRVPNQGEALEVLMQAILQLPVYLDRIQTARRDLPMVVLPLLNDLRAARGEKLLSETSLFAPDLSQRQPQLDGEAIAQLRTDELGGLLRKLRQTQQMALVGLLRNQDVATSLGYLARVYARLEGLCREAPLGPLWSIASGLVEGLANGSVVNSASVRTLLRQLDRELKRLVEQGADGLNQAAPDELVKNLLFYVAKAPSQSPRIRALKEQYRLDEALPDHETVDAERARLAGPDRDAMRSVVGALCEELVRIKDSLDLFVRSDRGHPSELDALLAPLKQIADTLAVLGFGQPRKVILDQLDVIHALAQGRREPSDAILMDVAGALLYVEATLAGMAGPGDERNSEESRLPTTDVAQIHQLVIKEARNGLEQAKDAIIEFIASQWNHEHLARVPELLTQVRGGLAMIPLERAATLLETCNRYIQEQLLARKAVPDWQSLDTLADAITSVEYYLERLSEDHASQSDLILDVAETAEQPPADTAPAEAAREDAPQLASDDNWTLGEVAPDAGEPSLDLALDLPLDDSAEVPPALPEVVEESGQPQSTPAPARSLDDFSLDEIDLSGLDLPADAAPASGPAALADWSLPEQWGLGDDLAQPAQAGETLDLSLEEPALSFDAPLESLEPLPALEPFDGSAEQELVLDALDPLPLDVALPEAEGEVSAWEGSSLEELDLSDLDLPEVQLPEAEAEAPPAAEALASEAPALSLAEVMAAPVQPINPPAQNVPVSLLPPPADEEPVDEELREVFIEEAGEVLETIGRYLPAWKADHDDREALTEVRRAFHTLKGSGRMVRALVIGELAWSIENLFNRVLDRSIAASEPVQRVVDQVVALLPELVEEFAANAQRQRDDVDLLAATAHALAKGEPLPEPPAPDDGGVPPEAGAEQPSSLDNGVQAPPLADAPQAAAEAQSDVELLDPQLLEIFTNEAETHLEALVGFLADCARELPQPVTDALQRALHTLKGSAHMAGILPIAEIATPLEKLVKEYKSNLLAFDLREAELLHDAEQLFRIGLEQVGAQRPLNPIPGSDALLERIEALHQERIASLEAERYSDAGERRDPLLIEAFLVEGMDILLDAEDLLERWHEHPQERQELSALREELSTLDRGARHAELPQVEELCQALLALYDAVEEGRLAVSPAFFEEARQAHEALIGMMDQVAAGLQVTPRPERVAALQELLEAPAAEAVPFIDPESLGADDFPPEDEEPALPEAVFEEAGTPAEETVPAAPAPAPGRELDEEMVSIFLEEAVDILESAGQALAQWQAEPGALSSLSALQRDLHTLKGGARMAEIAEIGDLAHELEALYEGLVDRRYQHSPQLAGLLQACHDRLAEQLDQLSAGQPLADPHDLIQSIRRFRQGPVAEAATPGEAESPVEELVAPAVEEPAAPAAEAFEERDPELVEIFLEEGFDILDSAAAALQRWMDDVDNTIELEALQRDLHTLKGGARLAGQTELGNLAHDLEQHLTDAQQQGAPWPDSLLLDAQSGLEGLQRQVDLLRERLAEDDEAGERPEPAQALVQADDTGRAVASALAELTRLAPAAGAIMAAEAAPPAAPATTLPFVRKAQEAAQEAASRRAPQELVKVPAELLENLVNLAGETSIFRGRVEQQVSDVGFTLGEMESTIERVRDQLRRLDTETQAQILSRHQADAERAGYEEFDPLEMDRYSQLQQLSRALFESASDLLDLKETLAAKNRDAETLLLQQARVNTELQEGLMRTRMVPFDRLVPRLRRIVRQVAGELGKQVEFVVGNADGEMDRTVLERIVAPLEHMLRNAVDHGIESGETRRAAGKPEHGTIRLNIGREGGDILLTLSDDGAGIRLDAVRRKAIERGLMSADSDLSDHEVLQFVLESGFSTAEKVTQISGRGVGLDVANSEVKQLGGSVSIQTEPGQGTRFNVRLPFTVSVNRALMVLSGEDLYAVPLNTIEGIVRVSPYELEALYDQRGEAGLDTPSFEYAGQSYELKYLGELLNNGQEPKLVGQSLPLPVILVRSSEHAVAVQVDSLAGSREIVVKSLGPQFAGVAGISGATLLGDGRVVVILDLLATIRSRHALLGQESRRERLALRQEMAASESEQQRPPLVMVVDDSVTVRKVTTRLLERNGMNVLTAKDGVDAIAQLQEHRPDILLLDIEMPRMDGFEVATLVRHDERLGNLPIIMITSRTGEKHRERALGIGVNQYLGKPYQETELLEAIQSLVGQHE